MRVVAVLDPVLVPLGFAGGQGGTSGEQCQVIYCSAHPRVEGGCADVVLDLRRLKDAEGWRIVDVSYDGFRDSHPGPLRLREDVGLLEQLDSLRTTIREDLHQGSP